jgi:dUTP pyrophosphatase
MYEVWGFDMNNLKIFFKKLSDKAVIPTYAQRGDACCDLYAIEDYIIYPGKIILARTGFAIAIPEGFEAQIRPRSGLAVKSGLSIPNSPATIDSGYRGEIKVPLINLGEQPIAIVEFDRIAQMKFAAAFTGHFLDVGDNELDGTERGVGGFGHTGR